MKDPETGEQVLVREKEEKKTAWVELFYDLIFVAVISKLCSFLPCSFSSNFSLLIVV
jgi:low temperature requirement protein LtrA